MSERGRHGCLCTPHHCASLPLCTSRAAAAAAAAAAALQRHGAAPGRLGMSLLSEFRHRRASNTPPHSLAYEMLLGLTAPRQCPNAVHTSLTSTRVRSSKLLSRLLRRLNSSNTLVPPLLPPARTPGHTCSSARGARHHSTAPKCRGVWHVRVHACVRWCACIMQRKGTGCVPRPLPRVRSTCTHSALAYGPHTRSSPSATVHACAHPHGPTCPSWRTHATTTSCGTRTYPHRHLQLPA